MSDTSSQDITTWPVEALDELGLIAYAGVEGVEIVEDDLGDENPEHGMNSEEEQILPPPPEDVGFLPAPPEV